MTTTDFKCNYCESVYAVYFCKDFAKLSPNNVLELANYIAQTLLQVFGRFEGIVMRDLLLYNRIAYEFVGESNNNFSNVFEKIGRRLIGWCDDISYGGFPFLFITIICEVFQD
uniref:Uncharacterized protein n=1 Tax=Vespula pensylvanica TaxID=30213 RepID=A0A834KME5_VESPE|nr:hypothetical protein H0235_014245 [Vespula pensylvanica]